MEPDDLAAPLADWCALATSTKDLFGWPEWELIAPWRETKSQAKKAGRKPFVSDVAKRCRLTVSLATPGGASLEGCQLQFLVWDGSFDDMTAILQTHHEGKFVCIARVDVRPRAPHSNRYWKRFGCPPEIVGTHIHHFEHNAQVGRDAFDPMGNLPVAMPVEPEPESFREFMALVGRAFRIDGLEGLPPPPAQEALL